MRSKLYIALGSVGTAVATLFAPLAHAQLTTTTLGSSIDSINGTYYDYFTVLLTHYWPFLVGAILLMVIWHFGKRMAFSFT